MSALLGISMTCAASAATTPALTAADLNAFLDGFVPISIGRADIAGATISVVKDGHVLSTRYFGYADVKSKLPVSDVTVFRPGSISKLLTWTAVMQQVERGKLNLDRDVNAYLDFTIPASFARPITLRDLMTHTAGFEETFKDQFDSSAAQLEPLGTYLKQHTPARLYPPGEVVSYSNYGASLAGYIVQRISGQQYDDYIERNIFRPLGMNHSTMRQPLPANLAPHLSRAYIVASGPPAPFEYIQVAPAGSLSSTTEDMARFMIAQLQDGRLGNEQILKPATARLMHSFQSTEAPGLNGFALGFYQENRNGLSILGHAGDTNFFHSDLHLILNRNVGFYISLNSAGKSGAAENIRAELFRAFLDRYYPFTPPNEATVSSAQADAKSVRGWYLSSRREQSAFPLLFMAGEAEVKALPDGMITFSPLKTPADTPKRWREVGPLVYREDEGPAHLVFLRNAGGISYVTTDDFLPVLIFQRVSFWRQLNVIQFVAEAALLIFLFTLIIWPIGFLIRRHYRPPLRLAPIEARLRIIARLTCAIALIAVAGWVFFASAVDKVHISDMLLVLLYAIGVISVAGTVGMVANAVVTCRSGKRSIVAKCAESLVALCGIGFAWLVLNFGLANFNLHY